MIAELSIIITVSIGAAAICQYMRQYAENLLDEIEKWKIDVFQDYMYKTLYSNNADLMENLKGQIDNLESKKPKRHATSIWAIVVCILIIAFYVLGRYLLLNSHINGKPFLDKDGTFLFICDIIIPSCLIFSSIWAATQAAFMQSQSTRLKRDFNLIKSSYTKLRATHSDINRS